MDRLKAFRLVILTIGVFMSIIALLAHKIGLGYAGQFGFRRFVLLLTGIFLLLLSLFIREKLIKHLNIFIRQIATPYRIIAIVLLTTLLMFVGLEIAAYLVNRGGVSSNVSFQLTLPYYRSQDWAKTYWSEHLSVVGKSQFLPYIGWNSAPFEGKTINIDKNGIRQTPGSDCHSDSYKVFAFGGSTMWGFGVPDWMTIPAFVQANLRSQYSRDKSVCVINFGGMGYISTQSLIFLIRLLESGNVPNVVIFYDGFNDSLFAYLSGQAGVHAGAEKIRSRIEHPFTSLLTESNFVALFQPIKKDKRTVTHSSENKPEALESQVVQTYLTNYLIVQALSVKYGFRFYFFLQPILPLGRKVMTVEESEMVLRSDYILPGLADFTKEVYRRIDLEIPHHNKLYNLTHVLDASNSQIWIDLCHITPEGNRLVADFITDVINQPQ